MAGGRAWHERIPRVRAPPIHAGCHRLPFLGPSTALRHGEQFNWVLIPELLLPAGRFGDGIHRDGD